MPRARGPARAGPRASAERVIGRRASDGACRRHSLDGVLRLQDVATGSWRDVRPVRPGLIQICAYLLSGDSRTGADLTSLRIMLVADLLARAAELSGMQALTAHVGDIRDPGIPSGLVMDSLGIHPPAAAAASAELLQTPWAGPADVYVVGSNASPEPGRPGICIAVGMARVGEAEGEVGHMTEVLCERDADPLALRLALMSVSYPGAATVQDDDRRPLRRTC